MANNAIKGEYQQLPADDNVFRPPEVAGAPTRQGPTTYAGLASLNNVNFDPTGKYKLRYEGAFAAAEIGVSPGDGFKSAGGAMITMSSNVAITTRFEGGLASSLLRCCCVGGSLLMSHYYNMDSSRGDVLLAPAFPGEVALLTLSHSRASGPTAWCITRHGFLACDESVDIGVRTLSTSQGCWGGEGFFVMEATGTGRLLINSFGSIARYELQPGEERKIDNGFLVAWDAGMEWSIGRATGSLAQSYLSGEGLVACFTGPGTVLVQTRALRGLARTLAPLMSSSGS